MNQITTTIGYWAEYIPDIDTYLVSLGIDKSNMQIYDAAVRHYNCKIQQRDESGLLLPVENSSNIYTKAYALELIDKIESKAEQLFCKGSSVCRLCHCTNGSAEYVFAKSFKNSRRRIVMPSGYRHYIEHHNVEPDTNNLITFATLLGFSV